MSDLTVNLALKDNVWLARARCGHYVKPEPVCEVEPNPPCAYCDECDGELVFFDGLYFDGDRLTFGATHGDTNG